MKKIINYLSQIFLLFLAVYLLSSCKTLTSNRMFETKSDYEYSEFKPSQKEYIIQPYDDLDLKIYSNKGDRLIDVKGNLRLQQNVIKYTVEFDGKVKVPTLGRITLSGLTVREAERLLEKEYSLFFQSPFVMLEVTNKRVIVFSSGSSEGNVIKFSNDNFTLIEALAESGGVNDYGKSYRIKLLRGDLNNPQIFMFNIRNMKDISDVNFRLQSNDIIYVEDRPRYAAKALQEVTPYLTLFTSIFTVYLLVSQNK